jgi:alcohol dehydrogenase (cytochrome c)
VKDWPLPNRDYTNSRATTDSTINAANVNTLGAAWAVPLPGVGAFGSASTTPIIMGNTAYFQDLGNNIFAVDLATGKIKWKHLFNESNIGPNGIAVGWGKIFGNSDPYTIVALDVNTGAQLWSTRISQQPTSGIDIQPNVYGNLVLVSTVPGTGGGDFYTGGGFGAIYALDQTSGKIMWNFDTVDSADIWGNKDVNSGGGAWYPPAVDTSTGTSFWGIGNPAPWPGTPTYPNGSSRPGPNLYTDSLVALNDTNGNLAWFTQVNQHDNSDADFEASPILASATVSGKQQDVVIGAGKLGKVVAFNRQTGAILWMTPVGMHQNDQLVNIPAAGAQVYPGIFGGVETPMAYAGGVVYVPVVNLYANLTPGAVTGTQPFNQGTGELVALDVNTGKILWDKSFNSLDVGGATVVNDLVFTSTLDGMVYALNRTTGAQVWSYQAPGGVNAWPAFAGDTMLLPVGLGSPFSVVLALKLGANSPALAMTPLDGTSLESGNITVSAMALNFKLVALLGDTNVAGEGHLHYFMDVDAPTVQGQPAVTSTGVYTATANTTYTFSNVTPGTHTFSVELVNNDHTPLNPPVVAKVTVTVTAPTPKITITSPQNRASIKPGDITISVSVSNFNLVDKIGQAIASGEGHIIYYMDVVPPTDPTQAATTAAGTYAATAATSYTWQNVAAGTHTFFVELVNNDNTPLTTPVVIQVVVTVTASTGGGP